MEYAKADANIDSKSSKLIFAAITIIATPIHEFGHMMGYWFSGIPAKYHFIYTESLNGSESIYAALGGPLLGFLLALVGCVFTYAFKEKKAVFISIYFTITMCLTRLVPYLLFTLIASKGSFAINDEGLIAKFLNVPEWQVYSTALLLFVSILMFLRLVNKESFDKCFKFAFTFYFIIAVLFQMKIY